MDAMNLLFLTRFDTIIDTLGRLPAGSQPTGDRPADLVYAPQTAIQPWVPWAMSGDHEASWAAAAASDLPSTDRTSWAAVAAAQGSPSSSSSWCTQAAQQKAQAGGAEAGGAEKKWW